VQRRRSTYSSHSFIIIYMPREGFQSIESFSNIPERTQEVRRVIPSAQEYIAILQKAGLETHEKAFENVLAICEAVKKEGGRALLVGGSVRDMVLQRISKDFDIEIYGLSPQKIEKIVATFGKVNEVGKAFGILKLSLDGIELDISLPRVDSKIAPGAKGFAAKGDPHMSIKDAARRRDFTMNALAADPLTGELFDYFGGVEDLRHRRLRITDPERFVEDPSRALRAMQFIGRLGLFVDPETVRIIQKVIPHLKELPAERIKGEWYKLLAKSEKPSVGLAAGMALGILRELHPEFPPLIETPQEQEWHPEGDVWIHTLMAVDEAVRICKREGLGSEKTFLIVLATLCHDLGKALVTEYKDGRWKSHGHDVAGEEPTKKFLLSLGIEGVLRDKVVKLVANHLTPSMFYIDETLRGITVSDGAIRRLAQRIHPATIQELTLVAEADHMGRGPFVDPEIPEQLLMPRDYFAGAWFVERARELGVEKSIPTDIIRGKDLITFGHTPGKNFWVVIHLANDLRDRKMTREEILREIYGRSMEDMIPHLQSLVHSRKE